MIAIVFIEVIRGVPLISILFMASVMLPLFMPSGVTVDKLLRAQIAIIIFAAAYIAEAVRGGLQAIPRGQHEASSAMGLHYWQSMRLVVLPQALKIAIPPLVNISIGFFQDTTLVTIIGLLDFLSTVRTAMRIRPGSASPSWKATSSRPSYSWCSPTEWAPIAGSWSVACVSGTTEQFKTLPHYLVYDSPYDERRLAMESLG